MKFALTPLLAASLFFWLTIAPSVTAQVATDRATRNHATAAPHHAPRFEQWYETVMPGKALNLRLPAGHRLMINGSPWSPAWRAPDSAQTLPATLISGSTAVATINIFVLEPRRNIDSNGWLNGYRIGTYPRNPPDGFIKLSGPQDRETRLSPHFKVGQFLCKQQPNHWPKYVLVSQNNVLRLEALLRSLNDDGTTDADTFFVMSGFRTPFYNTAIGSAKFSRHMYGDAADIYVDYKPRNGVMDDLNRDGEITKADANWLYDYAQTLFRKRTDLPKGGIGAYRANAVHGPFVHVDGRGTTARWGR
jgi:hypothetical protein